MALKRRTQTENANTSTPAFEGEDGNLNEVNAGAAQAGDEGQGTGNEPSQAEVDRAKAEDQQAAAQAAAAAAQEDDAPAAEQQKTDAAVTASRIAADLAVAVKPKLKGALVPVGGKLSDPFTEIENVIDIHTLRELTPGSFKKAVADRGGIEVDDENVGQTMVVDLMSYNERIVLSPGDDSDEAKQFVRVSYDGVTVEGELDENDNPVTVKDYIAYLKTEHGYEDASAKKYIDLWGQIVSTDKLGVIDEGERELVQMQLSPQSVGKFKAFRLNQAIAASRDKDVSARVKLTAVPDEWNGKKYARFEFSKA